VKVVTNPPKWLSPIALVSLAIPIAILVIMVTKPRFW
jgi:hypothetical protein